MKRALQGRFSTGSTSGDKGRPVRPDPLPQRPSVSFRPSWTLLLFLLAAICASAASLPEEAQKILTVGNFSAESLEAPLPSGWESVTFQNQKRHTRYRLVQTDGRVAIKAESRNSASGLIRKIRIDPRKHAILTWNWKVANTLEKGDTAKKEGDDFPARLYVTFEYDANKIGFWETVKYEAARLIYGEYPPLCAISYVWGYCFHEQIPDRRRSRVRAGQSVGFPIVASYRFENLLD